MKYERRVTVKITPWLMKLVAILFLITLVHAVNPALSLSLALGLEYYLNGVTCVKADVLSSYLINSSHFASFIRLNLCCFIYNVKIRYLFDITKKIS